MTTAITGIAEFLPKLDEYAREIEYHPTESWLEARDRKQREKKEAVQKLLAEVPKNCLFFLQHHPFRFCLH